ncbi:MAG: alpha/beta hydrolase, partial [Actinomycetota bacterium]|nr:alpha/beta hydrolase [Actinomycetota bacterium]
PGLRLLLRHGNPRGLPRHFIDRMYRDYDWGTKRAVLRLYRATRPGALEALLPAMRDIDPPALVVWGPHDPYISVKHAERQRQAFPSAEVVALDGSDFRLTAQGRKEAVPPRPDRCGTGRR